MFAFLAYTFAMKFIELRELVCPLNLSNNVIVNIMLRWHRIEIGSITTVKLMNLYEPVMKRDIGVLISTMAVFEI